MALTEIPSELSSTPSIVDNGNATAITIDSSENATFAGSVGIGQAPSAFSNWKILEIKGGTAGAMLNFENSSSTRVSTLAYDDGSDSLRIQNFLANPITFETNNTERMRIDGATGNVSIGTSNSLGILTLKAPASDDQDIITITEDGINQAFSINGNFAGAGSTGNAITLDSYWTNDIIVFRGDGSVGIGVAAPAALLHVNDPVSGNFGGEIRVGGTGSGRVLRLFQESATDYGLYATGTSSILKFGTAGSAGVGTERARLDASGVFLLGMTAANGVGGQPSDVNGVEIGRGYINLNRDDTASVTQIQFGKNGSRAGKINTVSTGNGSMIVGNYASGIMFRGDLTSSAFIPASPASNNQLDNTLDVGHAAIRFDDIYATNPTIQTSDRNEKQDIEELSEAEQRVAVACKGLLRKFRWIDAVEAKGDDARIHFGIIAQDLQAAFEAEGLDAGRYAMFISSTWWETKTEVAAVEATEDTEAVDAYTRTDTYHTAEAAPEGATERTRLGIRSSELLAFIISAI